MSQVSDSQKWMIFTSLAAVSLLLYLLSPILTPFFVAALLAYLGDPLADRLEKRFSRTVSVSIVFIVIFVVIAVMTFLVFPLLAQQLSYLVSNMPAYIDNLQHNVLPSVAGGLGLDVSMIDFELLKNL